MKRRKKIIIIITSVLLVSNLPILNTEILKKIDSEHFKYSNNNGSFTNIEHIDIFSPWSSKKLNVSYIIGDNNIEAENQEIYRIYKINPFCFWRWRYYLSVSRHFEYKSWKEIESNRVPFNPDNIWQHF